MHAPGGDENGDRDYRIGAFIEGLGVMAWCARVLFVCGGGRVEVSG